jgi:uncharacterized protein (DUF983 family)
MADAPQFGTAEYSSQPGAERCKSCGTTLTDRYYRVNGAPACESCAEKLKFQIPQDTHQTFVRGLLFGVGGAILGLIIYAAFGIITGLMIGYVSLAVGYIVGKAMMKGSNGIGGRRYQIAAVALTYAAVSLAAVPISISQFIKNEKERKQNAVRHLQAPPAPSGQAATAPDDASTSESAAESEPVSSKPKQSFGAAIGMLALNGLASPFLELQDPVHGIIGLVILVVGIRIAWRLTAGTKVDILGPFNQSKTSAETATS